MSDVALGALVKVDGALAQVVDYFPAEDKYQITKVNGESKQVAPGDLTQVNDLGRPGQGGDEDSFDVLVGPRLVPEVLAEEVGTCIMEKGFCVLRVCQNVEKVSAAVEHVRSMAQETPSRLRRLPEEVESGYLGVHHRAKVTFMEPGATCCPKDATLKANDEFLTRLVSSINTHTLNSFGKIAEAREPAVISLSLQPGEEAEFPHPFADHQELSKLLKIWNRSILKAAHFMGPGTAQVFLSKQGEEELPIPQDGEVKINAVPNTIVLFRNDCFSYACGCEEEVLAMTVQFTEPETRLKPMTAGLEQLDLASMDLPGPKLPSGTGDEGHVVVYNAATRLMASWNSPEMYQFGLQKGCDSALQIPITRFDIQLYYNSDFFSLQPWQICFQHMAFVEALELFDNTYFNIPKAECIGYDPMHRHLLETGAMNLHKMGITKKFADRNPHHAGCGVGLDKDDWHQSKDVPLDGLVEASMGINVQAIISNRFNYTFNLKGASFVVDTACSSSLTCTHMGAVMMANRKTDKLDFFICSGLHQCHSTGPWVGMSQTHMASVIGRCSTFNETADGYMRGDGCSAIALKHGLKTEDVLAVWRGSMVGQNGRSATLTAPNGLAQEDVMWRAIREADSSPVEATIWSCHGTGTNLGDPIEVGSSRKLLKGLDRTTALMIGTNKTNTGHLEGGAAMTSIIAGIYQIKCQYANPLLHGNVLNTYLELSAFEAFFNYEQGPTNQHKGHMHVSSFGFGGTNAHCVMWGDNKCLAASPTNIWKHQMAKLNPPEITATGDDPSTWTSSLPDEIVRPGDIWSISVQKGDPFAAMKWEKTQEGLSDDYDLDNVSYSILGDFNEWKPEVMEDGDVHGLRIFCIDVPASGQVQFRFAQTVDSDMVLAPVSNKCGKKTATILGPSAGLENSWVARGVEGGLLKISLFTSHRRYAVSWMTIM